MTRRAKFLISAELLRDLLEFPTGVVIVGDVKGKVILTLESEMVPEGTEWVLPVWIRKEEGEELWNELLSMDAIPAPIEFGE